MAEHQGLPVAGYNPQTTDKVALVNENKVLEERCLRQIDKLMTECQDSDFDRRMAALAITNIQQGFMWLNRAVFQPSRVDLPEEKKD